MVNFWKDFKLDPKAPQVLGFLAENGKRLKRKGNQVAQVVSARPSREAIVRVMKLYTKKFEVE